MLRGMSTNSLISSSDSSLNTHNSSSFKSEIVEANLFKKTWFGWPLLDSCNRTLLNSNGNFWSCWCNLFIAILLFWGRFWMPTETKRNNNSNDLRFAFAQFAILIPEGVCTIFLSTFIWNCCMSMSNASKNNLDNNFNFESLFIAHFLLEFRCFSPWLSRRPTP